MTAATSVEGCGMAISEIEAVLLAGAISIKGGARASRFLIISSN